MASSPCCRGPGACNVSEPSDKDEFKRRVLEWAEKLDVQVRSITVRPMKSKWASCSTAGNFTFNAELLAFDRHVADYVIVHELLHFFTPNHGKLWKSLMRAHLGDYEKAKAELERHILKSPGKK